MKSSLDGTLLGKARLWSRDEALAALERAREAQARWARTSHAERRALIRRWLAVMKERADELARALSAENGKTVHEAYLTEIISLMLLGRYFSDKAESILKPQRIRLSLFKNRASYLIYAPRGVVFVIAPWNFPLAIPMGTVVMALLAGNAVVLKPASLTPLIASRMRDTFIEAGLDADLFQVITGPGKLASEIIDSGKVDYVNFTGSTAVGRTVAERAARRMIPCSMELGGKAPAIVLEDADVEKTARAVTWGAFANSGQVCASVERVYVHESLYEGFLARVAAITKALRQGNPLRGEEVDVGAMTDPGQVDIVERQVADAVSHGAKLLAGGKRLDGPGNYFAPTVLADVTDDMAVAREETFGPVMPVMPFSTIDEAVRRANDSPYGLLAYVFTRDVDKGRAVAERIEAGTVMVNDTLMTHAFPETPWAGVKQSGTGRVHSDEGLRDLCQTRHINYDVISMHNPIWYPYRPEVLDRFIALSGLFTRSHTFGEGFGLVARLFKPRKRQGAGKKDDG